jgi:hypothetical protein
VASIEAAMPSPEPDRVDIDLSLLSNDQRAILEDLCERRDAWPGSVDDWMKHGLSIADRQHLFEIGVTLNGGDAANGGHAGPAQARPAGT